MSNTESNQAFAFLRAVSTRALTVASLGDVDSESDLINAAAGLGYTFSLQEWQDAVKQVIKTSLDEKPHDPTIALLQQPVASHSAELREWVHELCHHEGEPAWSKDEDFKARVNHILHQLASPSEPSLFEDCDEEQLQGKRWLPNPFGLWTETGDTGLVFSWGEVISSLE